MTRPRLVDPPPSTLAPDFAAGALSIAAASEFSSLSRRTLYELMESGALAFTKVGRRRLIPRAALVALLARGVD